MRSLLQKRIITSFFLTLVVFTSFLVPFSSFVNVIEKKQSVSYAQTTQTPPVQTPGDSDTAPDAGLPACGPLNGWLGTGGSLMGCVAMLAYYVLYRPASVIAFLAASFLDFFIGYSLSDTSYRNPFVEIGWKLIRDISNIAFILVLLYVAIQGMFTRSGGSEFKKTLPNIILMAILINFSLFFTRVIIDVSNITSRVFYNSIEVTKEGTDDPANLFGTKSVSTAIATSINPQRILSGVQIQAGSVVEVPGQQNTKPLSKSEHASFYLIVILAAVVICLVMAWVFFSSAFIFLGRVVGLYFAMIFSPFAFMSRIYPKISSTDQIGWKAWLDNVTQLALVGPIFTFYLFLTAQFAKFSNQVIGKLQTSSGTETAFAQTVGTGANGFFPMLFGVMMPMAIITALLLVAQKYAKNHAGVIGKMAVSAGSFLAGAAVGVATGGLSAGVASLGRGTLGRAGSSLANSQTLQNMSARGNALQRTFANATLRGSRNLQTRSFDVRNTDTFRRNATGVQTDSALLRTLRVSTQNTQNGYVGSVGRNTARIQEQAQLFQMSDRSRRQQNQRSEAWEQQYRTQRDAEATAQGANFNEVAFRQQYINDQAAAGNTRPQTADEVATQRNREYVARLQRGSWLGRVSERVTGAQAATATGISTAVSAGIAAPVVTLASTVLSETGAHREAEQSVAQTMNSQLPRELSPAQRTRLENRLTTANQRLAQATTDMQTIAGRRGIAVEQVDNRVLQEEAALIQTYLEQINDQIDRTKKNINNNINDPTKTAQVLAWQDSLNRAGGLIEQKRDTRTRLDSTRNLLNDRTRLETEITDIRKQLGI